MHDTTNSDKMWQDLTAAFVDRSITRDIDAPFVTIDEDNLSLWWKLLEQSGHIDSLELEIAGRPIRLAVNPSAVHGVLNLLLHLSSNHNRPNQGDALTGTISQPAIPSGAVPQSLPLFDSALSDNNAANLELPLLLLFQDSVNSSLRWLGAISPNERSNHHTAIASSLSTIQCLLNNLTEKAPQIDALLHPQVGGSRGERNAAALLIHTALNSVGILNSSTNRLNFVWRVWQAVEASAGAASSGPAVLIQPLIQASVLSFVFVCTAADYFISALVPSSHVERDAAAELSFLVHILPDHLATHWIRSLRRFESLSRQVADELRQDCIAQLRGLPGQVLRSLNSTSSSELLSRGIVPPNVFALRCLTPPLHKFATAVDIHLLKALNESLNAKAPTFPLLLWNDLLTSCRASCDVAQKLMYGWLTQGYLDRTPAQVEVPTLSSLHRRLTSDMRSEISASVSRDFCGIQVDLLAASTKEMHGVDLFDNLHFCLSSPRPDHTMPDTLKQNLSLWSVLLKELDQEWSKNQRTRQVDLAGGISLLVRQQLHLWRANHHLSQSYIISKQLTRRGDNVELTRHVDWLWWSLSRCLSAVADYIFEQIGSARLEEEDLEYKDATSIDVAVRAAVSRLARLLDQCLLSPQYAPLWAVFSRQMLAAEKIHSLLDRFTESGDEDELDLQVTPLLEQQRKSIAFLIALLDRLIGSAVASSSRLLSLRLRLCLNEGGVSLNPNTLHY